MLEARGVSRRYGAFVALSDVDLHVEEGAIYGVIGPNGAGKTTFFDVLSGLRPPSGGTITFRGRDVSRQEIASRVRQGMARTFQTPRLFDESTVAKNLRTAGFARQSLLRQLVPTRATRHRIEEDCQRILDLLGIRELADQPAGDLPYARRRLTEIGRALMLHPKMLLLDEPAAGMNSSETRDFALLLRRLREIGVTLLVIEHDMDFIMNLCERCTVLNMGSPIATGTPDEIRANPAVLEAYLGSEG